MKRSQNFNYFTQDKDPVEKRKTILKKVWKWFKVVFYIFMAGLTLTGCVQSMVVKAANNTGAGIEYTTNREEISPKVTVLDHATEKLELPSTDPKNKETIDIDTYKVNTNINPNITDKTTLKGLSKQINGENGKQGFFQKDNSYSVAFTTQNDPTKVINKNGNYLAASVGTSENQFGKLAPYNYVNELTDIYFFNFYNNWISKNKAFIKYKKVTKEVQKDGTEVENTSSVQDFKEATPNQDGLYEVVWTSGIALVSDELNPNIKPDDKLYEQKKLINKFNRDVLQQFYSYTFNADSQFVKELGKDPSLFLKEKIDSIQDKTVYTSDQKAKTIFTLTKKEVILLNKYIELMTSWLTLTGYMANVNNVFVTSQIESDSKYLNENPNESRKELINNGDKSTKYDASANKIFVVSAVNKIPFQDALPLLNISTWGEAWKYGPFYGIFYYPTAFITSIIAKGIGTINGWGTIIVLFLVTFTIRLIVFALTFKSTAKMSIQEELKSKKAAIEAKYVGFENNKAMKARKAQELSALNKKYNINPFDTLATTLITFPIFITMWRVIQTIPVLKSTTWLGINFASRSTSKLMEGHWVYLVIIAVAIIVQLVSTFLPSILNKKQYKQRTSIAEQQAMKKQEKTQKIISLVFTAMVLMFSAGVQVYWTITGLFTIIQTLFMHKIKKTQWFKDRYSLKAMSRK